MVEWGAVHLSCIVLCIREGRDKVRVCGDKCIQITMGRVRMNEWCSFSIVANGDCSPFALSHVVNKNGGAFTVLCHSLMQEGVVALHVGQSFLCM